MASLRECFQLFRQMVRCLWLLYLGTLNQHLRYCTWHGSHKDACPAVQWHDTCFAALLWQNLTFWMCWMKLKSELPTNSMGKEFPISQVILLNFLFPNMVLKNCVLKCANHVFSNFSQHGRFAKSGGWVWDLPWLEDRHVCSKEMERPPSQGTKLHPFRREPHWSS